MAWVRVQWRCSRSRGTGEVPPTGRTLRLPLCDLFEVAAGRVARIHAYYDQIPFAAHLELLPLSGSYTRGAICFPAVARSAERTAFAQCFGREDDGPDRWRQ